ncbi:MAG: glycosyltransferase family 4 protein [Candidatus Daviesbacteria bacterium]|nr:glycosyltransferase family 4 protein [Candidatus Daviesbacteria bacterium]
MVKTVMIIAKHLIYGGTEKYTLNLVNSLVDKGISVVLVTSGGPLTSHISSNAKVFITPISRKYRIKEITEKRILEIARIYKPQVIHTQCRTSLVCSQLARTTLSIPLVTHEHHMYNKEDYPFIVNELNDGADKIITIGPYTAKELIKNGLKKNKIISILNGVDVQKVLPVTEQERKLARKYFNFNEKDKVIVCLSRVEPGKGIDKLIRGFVKVSKQIPEAKLVIAGDDYWDPLKTDLNDMRIAYNLQKKLFLFPGEYNVRKYHAVADVFCYPAIAKGMAVMEAMAAGLPVVGRKTIRKPLVVENNISGLMTNPTSSYVIDPDQIAEKLIYLLERISLARTMGKAARERIETKFNLENVVKKIMHTYEETISIRHLSPSRLYRYLNQ